MARMRKAAAIRRRLENVLVESAVDDARLFTIELARWFSRPGPLEVEIGSGAGDFITERAAAMPSRNFIAIELAALLHRLLQARAARSELTNLIVLRADARSIVNIFLPENSVARYHVYFPDPWPKKRHAKHRLFSPSFVTGLKRTINQDGEVLIATDFAAYAEIIRAQMEQGGFLISGSPVEASSSTRFGRKYSTAGKPIHTFAFKLA
jgi:tRNA (guanine-N7-)-methyltransferase